MSHFSRTNAIVRPCFRDNEAAHYGFQQDSPVVVLKTTTRLVVLCAVMAASLAGCTSRSSGPPVKTVRIALPRDAITWLPVHLAQSLGYYREEGLALAFSDVAGPTNRDEPIHRFRGSADGDAVAERAWVHAADL